MSRTDRSLVKHSRKEGRNLLVVAGEPQRLLQKRGFLQVEPEGIAETLPAAGHQILEREIIVNGRREL